MSSKPRVLEIAGREVRITSPDKVYFERAGHSKLDVVRYYLAVAEGVLRAVGGRPIVLRRFVHGAGGKSFYQKRAPSKRPSWLETVTLRFPSGRSAEELVLRDAAQLAWVVNLGCLEQHPHPVRARDLDHPDELRVDLDPVPGVEWSQIVDVAEQTREVLEELGLVGWPKTSGSRGLHIYVRLQPRWAFDEVRRAALAIAREVERRAPQIATSAWWKEERRGVFLDYNQNAKDRTMAAAYSVRPTPDARVSMPFDWSQLHEIDPAAYTLDTVPEIFASRGDAAAGIDENPCSLDAALELVAQHEELGLADAPWPPYYRQQAGHRRSQKPLLVIAKAEYEEEARDGLERWRRKHPRAASHLQPADVLVDTMRGRSSTWTRIRVNLEHVPEDLRPEQEEPDPDYDPWPSSRGDSGTGEEPD